MTLTHANRLLAARTAMLAATLFAILLFVSPARSHEFGSLKIAATFNADSTYVVDITIFGEHLPAALRPPVGDAPRLTKYLTDFADAAQIDFDGTMVKPEFVPLAEPIAAQASALVGGYPPTLRLRGQVPLGASTFRWSHPWPVDDHLLNTRNAGDDEPLGQWISSSATSEPFTLYRRTPARTTVEVMAKYAELGFTHIVPKGLDHILFVLSLFLLSLNPRAILAQVTAFTIAHSVTLALSIYGVIQLPSSIVEPLIALSITFVAIENIVIKSTDGARPTRTLVVFIFGLLHGLGFAGVLTEIGLPRSQFLPALISFNIGVELGQLAVIAAAYLAVGAWFGRKEWYRSRITIPASLAIACTGLYWTVTRVMG